MENRTVTYNPRHLHRPGNYIHKLLVGRKKHFPSAISGPVFLSQLLLIQVLQSNYVCSGVTTECRTEQIANGSLYMECNKTQMVGNNEE